MKRNFIGSTLFELCIYVLILAITMTIALPSLSLAMAKAQCKSTLTELYELMNLAKSVAINQHTAVTICPSPDQIHCSDNWHDPILIFADREQTHCRDSTDPLITYAAVLHGPGHLIAKVFPKQSYLQFNSLGQFMAHNGTIQYCANTLDPHSSKALIISKSGKIRWSEDNDHDGIDENADNSKLSC